MSQEQTPFTPLELRPQPSLFDTQSRSEDRSQNERAAELAALPDFVRVQKRASRSFRFEENKSFSIMSNLGENPAHHEMGFCTFSPSNELVLPLMSLQRTKSNQDCPQRLTQKRLSNFSILATITDAVQRVEPPTSEAQQDENLLQTFGTPHFANQRSSYNPSNSIFQFKIEDPAPRVSVSEPLDHFDFNKLVNYLTKFFKGEKVHQLEVQFRSEELSILRSIVRRKYKKHVDPQ